MSEGVSDVLDECGGVSVWRGVEGYEQGCAAVQLDADVQQTKRKLWVVAKCEASGSGLRKGLGKAVYDTTMGSIALFLC